MVSGACRSWLSPSTVMLRYNVNRLLRPEMRPRYNSLIKKPDNMSVSWHRLAEMLDGRDGRFKHVRLGRCRRPKVTHPAIY